MSVLVTDNGFATDDWDGDIVQWDQISDGHLPTALDLSSDAEPQDISQMLGGLSLIRVDFPSFADGRGFTIAAQLRRMGYQGRLRAKGHVISDQFAMARRSGFDEVEISDDLAARQPEDQWLRRANWRAHDYQARMRG